MTSDMIEWLSSTMMFQFDIIFIYCENIQWININKNQSNDINKYCQLQYQETSIIKSSIFELQRMLQVDAYDNLHKYQTQGQIRKKIQHYSFCLNDKIGKGFSSTVYKGRNDLTNQTVAIKVIQLKSLRDQVTKNLLQTQLECIKRINHQFLLKYIDSYETINNCYIITQFCQGGDLEKQLRVKGRFTESELIAFFAQFYSGYQSFLNAGFIHRDLKPANIFIKGDQIRIADFGMVKKTIQNPRDNYNVGTPVYMSPQSMISNIYSQKSDVWSIGVMCYQLTHGTLPWKGANEQQLKMNVQNMRVIYDYNLVSADLIKFISQCLDKNPNTRMSIADMMGGPWMQSVKSVMDNLYMPLPRDYFRYNSPNICYKNNLNPAISHTPVQVLGQRNMNMMPSFGSTMTPKSLNNNLSTPTMLPHLSSIPSLQIGETNENINYLNRAPSLKSQRPTMDSQTTNHIARERRKSSFMESNKAHSNTNAHTNTDISKRPALDYLVSILNYLRYIYKVIKVVNNSSCSLLADNLRNSTKSALIRQLMRCLSSQQRMVKNKQNIFGLGDWQEFKDGKKWSTFAGVVDQYSYKYRKIYEQQQKQLKQPLTQSPYAEEHIRLAQTLRPLLQQVHKILNYQIDQNRQVFELAEIADYLVSLYNFEECIYNHGWITFVDKSQINNIVECRCEVNAGNYDEIWRNLQTKIKAIVKEY